nr:FecR domain-containing protein [uncultured Roseateles sp.]
MRSQGGQGTEQPPRPEPVVSQEIAAEAAVWIARLHGPGRSIRMERACLAWQARSSAHRLAFERCTDLWMDAAGLARSSTARAPSSRVQDDKQRARRFQIRPWAVAPTAALLVCVLWLQPWRDVDTYDTGVGEQRLVVLLDGTRMSLNTSTKVRVVLGTAQRTVNVEGGEAFFEVAKDASRPFVVRAADAEVTATGTAFLVRLTPSVGAREDLDVTLVEGQVVVRSAASGAAANAFAQPVVMAAGERIRVNGDTGKRGVKGSQEPGAAQPQRDRPRMDQVLAWKRGEAIFDNLPLIEALAEMNRYSATPIVAESVGLAGLRISGVFKTGDNLSFAHAIASLHGLAVREGSNRLELVSK